MLIHEAPPPPSPLSSNKKNTLVASIARFSVILSIFLIADGPSFCLRKYVFTFTDGLPIDVLFTLYLHGYITQAVYWNC